MKNNFGIDYVFACAVALVAGLLSAYTAQVVGMIAVADGQGWDGSVFVRVIQEIASGHYSNSDPYRTVRTSAFPVIYVIELFHMDVNVVPAQRAFNIALIMMSAASLYMAARFKGVFRMHALLSCATFLLAWCVLVVPVFTPVLTDHLVLFTSSLSLLLWAVGRRFSLGILIFLCVWIMPTAALIPIALLMLRDGRGVSGSATASSAGVEIFSVAMGLGLLILVYVSMGGTLFEGVETHSYDFDRNQGADLTGSSKMLPLSIFIVVVMLWVAMRSLIYFIRSNWNNFSVPWMLFGLCVAALSFAVMRISIDFNTGFSSSQLFSHITKQALSAPFKAWVSHFAYFGPVVIVVYYFVIFRRSAQIPAALAGCLIGFLPLLALGSESRQWISIFPVIAMASAFVPLSIAARVAMLVSTALMLWGIWHLNQEVTAAVVENVGLQHPLWHRYFGRVGPWMTMGVYYHWLVVCGVVAAVIFGADRLQRARSLGSSDRSLS